MDLDLKKLPKHIAIIMDGNGRWAQRQDLPRVEGHRRGMETVEEIIETCSDLEIPYLTLYAFSMENWARPKEEVDALMAILKEFLQIKCKKLIDNEIRLETIGDVSHLPDNVRQVLDDVKRQTAHLSKMVLCLALSYGARDEIVRAVKKVINECEQGHLDKSDISAEVFEKYLDTSFLPEPDLLIRTSGESRTSNFLLWQTAYSEFIFTDTLWPDFHKDKLIETLCEYQQRERRFGQTSDQVQVSDA
jgi:undecaprenyl diphosphate synthase